MLRRLLPMAIALMPVLAGAGEMEPRPGWQVFPTTLGYKALIEAVKTSAKDNGMAVVTEAGPTDAAAARGVVIPGNRVIGVFSNEMAVRVLALSTAAMIEAPIRFYVTGNADGTATLSYKTPSFVFAPYMAEGGAELGEVAAELDGIFGAIAAGAVR